MANLLEERLPFEKLLVELSGAFVNLPLDEIDAQIDRGLRSLGTLLDIDRSSFAEFSEDKPDMVVTHSYVAPGIEPFPPVIVEEQLPWYANQIRRGEALRFSNLPDCLPPDAVAEREYCLRNGLKSNLAIPLKAGGSLNCVITFSSFREHRDWPEDLVQRLWLIGEVFATSIARKRHEQKMQRLRDQLARMGRITLVGELAAALAHEINQPLCAIVANAQAAQRLLSCEAPDLAEVRDALSDIATDSRRATEVVLHIRNMLQKREPERTVLRLGDALAEIVAMLRGQLMQHGISASLDMPADSPRVLGDRVQLQQVVLNLALNAIDAMVGAAGKPRQLCLALREEAGQALMSVRDTGPGIAAENLESVFDAFFTTKAGGIGIGLAISRTIIESHGGRIWADSQPGRGAAFHFTLPLAEDL